MNKIGFGFLRLPQTAAGADIDWALLDRILTQRRCPEKNRQ